MSEPVVKVENLNVWYGKPQFFGRSKRIPSAGLVRGGRHRGLSLFKFLFK